MSKSMGDGRAFAAIKRQLAEFLIDSSAPTRDLQAVVDEVGCCRRTVYSYKQNLQLYGTTLSPSISRKDGPSIFTQ